MLASKSHYGFWLFEKFPEVVDVMSTRADGDMSDRRQSLQNITQFLKQIDVSPDHLVLMDQIHETTVSVITDEQSLSFIPKTDALITQAKNVFLGIKAADCVPLFFYDPEKHITAVAHAGWRGTHRQIATEVIKKFIELGSDVKNICVAIGPHIAGCCYMVEEDRAKLFTGENVAFQSQHKWYIDIGQANRLELLRSGILHKHMNVLLACTSCQNDRYFSNRKDGPATGRMLGIIGMRG